MTDSGTHSGRVQQVTRFARHNGHHETGPVAGKETHISFVREVTDRATPNSETGSDETHDASQRGRSGATLQSASPGDRPAVSGANTCKPKTTRPRASSIGDKGDPQRDCQTPSSAATNDNEVPTLRQPSDATADAREPEGVMTSKADARRVASTATGIQIGARQRRTRPAGRGFRVTEEVSDFAEEIRTTTS